MRAVFTAEVMQIEFYINLTEDNMFVLFVCIFVISLVTCNGVKPGRFGVSLCGAVPEADGVPVSVQSLEILLIIDPLFASRALGQTFSSCNDTGHPG